MSQLPIAELILPSLLLALAWIARGIHATFQRVWRQWQARPTRIEASAFATRLEEATAAFLRDSATSRFFVYEPLVVDIRIDGQLNRTDCKRAPYSNRLTISSPTWGSEEQYYAVRTSELASPVRPECAADLTRYAIVSLKWYRLSYIIATFFPHLLPHFRHDLREQFRKSPSLSMYLNAWYETESVDAHIPTALPMTSRKP